MQYEAQELAKELGIDDPEAIERIRKALVHSANSALSDAAWNSVGL